MAAVIHHWPSTHNATDLHISSQDHTDLIERARAALQAISLTCHMLLPLCQRGLFATVKLTSIGSSAEKWRMFERLQDFWGFSSHCVAQTRRVSMRKQKAIANIIYVFKSFFSFWDVTGTIFYDEA